MCRNVTISAFSTGERTPRFSRLPRNGLTLIEVMVVTAIIALLIAILLPAFAQVRGKARRTACLSNLHQIHMASMSYSITWNDYFPDKATLGEHSYRIKPGQRLGDGPLDLPETFGLAAVLDRYKELSASSDVWICPDAADWMVEYGNTYAFSIATVIEEHKWTTLMTRKNPAVFKTWWVWDNFTSMPGDPGYRGPFGQGYAIPEEDRHYPHYVLKEKSRAKSRAVNIVYLDGHAAPRFEQ